MTAKAEKKFYFIVVRNKIVDGIERRAPVADLFRRFYGTQKDAEAVGTKYNKFLNNNEVTTTLLKRGKYWYFILIVSSLETVKRYGAEGAKFYEPDELVIIKSKLVVNPEEPLAPLPAPVEKAEAPLDAVDSLNCPAEAAPAHAEDPAPEEKPKMPDKPMVRFASLQPGVVFYMPGGGESWGENNNRIRFHIHFE